MALYFSKTGYRVRVAMENVRRQVLSRLRRGPAAEGALARWCDLRQVRQVRPVLQRMLIRREIRPLGKRYALPFNPLSPAGYITIGRGSVWGAGRA